MVYDNTCMWVCVTFAIFNFFVGICISKSGIYGKVIVITDSYIYGVSTNFFFCSESGGKMKQGPTMMEMETVQSPATGQGSNDGDSAMKMKKK